MKIVRAELYVYVGSLTSSAYRIYLFEHMIDTSKASQFHQSNLEGQ